MFSLRYKVSFLFLAVLLVTLLSCALLVDYRVSQAIEEELHQELHHQMQQIFQNLRSSELLLQQQADHLHQSFRLNNIELGDRVLSYPLDELLPSHHDASGLTGLSWYDAAGQLRLHSHQVRSLDQHLAKQAHWKIQTPHTDRGLLWQQQGVWRWFKQPLVAGQGYLILWQAIDIDYIKKIYQQNLNQEQSSTLMLLHEGKIFFNYGYTQEKAGLYPAWQHALGDVFQQLNQTQAYRVLGKTQQVKLLDERFVYIIGPEQALSPPFLIAYSLEQRLRFLKNLYHDLILLACLLLAIGGLLAAPLSRWGFSSLQQLLIATEKIQQENYQFRLPITGKDEFATLSNSMNSMLERLEQQQHKQHLMSQLISRELLDNMLHGQLSQQAHFRRTTILYCEVAQFERIYNKLAPSVALDFINNYFTRLQFAIDAYNGVVDGYTGSATRVLFGLANNQENAVLQAIYAALSISNAVDLFNLEVAKPLDKRVQIGIGIHYERLLLGRLGAENRRFYSALGSGLNISQWLEQLTQEYNAGILISKQALQQAQKDPAAQQLEHRYIATRQPPFPHPPVEIYQITLNNSSDSVTAFEYQ